LALFLHISARAYVIRCHAFEFILNFLQSLDRTGDIVQIFTNASLYLISWKVTDQNTPKPALSNRALLESL